MGDTTRISVLTDSYNKNKEIGFKYCDENRYHAAARPFYKAARDAYLLSTLTTGSIKERWLRQSDKFYESAERCENYATPDPVGATSQTSSGTSSQMPKRPSKPSSNATSSGKNEKVEQGKSNPGTEDKATGFKPLSKEDFDKNPFNGKLITLDEEMSEEEAYKQLEELTGLQGVKTQVRQFIAKNKVQAERARRGMNVQESSAHMAFTGNPGTGKTTVAQIVAQIFYSSHIIPAPRFLSVTRGDIVGQHVGETALKIIDAVDMADGGVLFIDEAYALDPGDSTVDYGREAIATLVGEMEKRRQHLVVILAGYTQETVHMIKHTNPGLESRFGGRIIEFSDYTPDEMMKIFELMLKKNGLKLTRGAKDLVADYFQDVYDKRGVNFGNGRAVRNVLEQLEDRLSLRIGFENLSSKSDEELATIIEDDVRTLPVPQFESEDGSKPYKQDLSIKEKQKEELNTNIPRTSVLESNLTETEIAKILDEEFDKIVAEGDIEVEGDVIGETFAPKLVGLSERTIRGIVKLCSSMAYDRASNKEDENFGFKFISKEDVLKAIKSLSK